METEQDSIGLLPDPPVLHAKGGLEIRLEFLVVLSQLVRKTGNPIGLLGLK